MNREDRAGSKNSMAPTLADLKNERAKKSDALLRRMYGLNTDMHFCTNSGGKYECSLCHTVHTTIQSFAAHRAGKRHSARAKRQIARPAPKIGNVKVRGLVKDGLHGFGVEIELGKARQRPQYKFVETQNESIVYVCAEPYKVRGFRYKGNVVSDHFSEHFDAKERRYFLHFFMRPQ